MVLLSLSGVIAGASREREGGPREAQRCPPHRPARSAPKALRTQVAVRMRGPDALLGLLRDLGPQLTSSWAAAGPEPRSASLEEYAVDSYLCGMSGRASANKVLETFLALP